jgi:hypothetical protein
MKNKSPRVIAYQNNVKGSNKKKKKNRSQSINNSINQKTKTLFK